MENLKKLAAAVVLICALSLSAFADDPVTPPCAPPSPGQIETPPCAMAQAPTSDLVTPTKEASLTEIAANVIFGIASLF